jgi:hypothetical protein
MQTSIWITYSDSTHFSEQFSYKTLFISSYGSKDMNLPRFAYLQEFRKLRKKTARAETGPDMRRRIVTVARGRRAAPVGSGPRPNSGARSEQK